MYWVPHSPLLSPPVLNLRAVGFCWLVADTLLCTLEPLPTTCAGDWAAFAVFISLFWRPWLLVICRSDKLLPDLESLSSCKTRWKSNTFRNLPTEFYSIVSSRFVVYIFTHYKPFAILNYCLQVWIKTPLHSITYQCSQ